jgi:hypothetical protein
MILISLRSYNMLYRLSQEERSIFWEVIVPAILRKKNCICTCVLFRTVISLYSSKIIDKKEILRTISIPAFIVQVTKLVQFT